MAIRVFVAPAVGIGIHPCFPRATATITHLPNGQPLIVASQNMN